MGSDNSFDLNSPVTEFTLQMFASLPIMMLAIVSGKNKNMIQKKPSACDFLDAYLGSHAPPGKCQNIKVFKVLCVRQKQVLRT